MPLQHKTQKTISEGRFTPLGPSIDKNGVNFAIYSKNAMQAFLLLYDEPDGDPTDIIRMPGRTRNIFHVFVEGIKPGQLYGYKMMGEYFPEKGLRFNSEKLLIDPYAKALTGKAINTDNLLLAYDLASPLNDRSYDMRKSDNCVPKGIIIDNIFDWQNDHPPSIPVEKLIIYELHVKGFTASKNSGVKNRGTYLGLIEKIPYLQSLGINAVELMPCQDFYVEDFLVGKGLTNFWGYNTESFFAPEIGYSSQNSPACQVAEFKTMVREFHKAGIEIIMDVVYNHTAEGNEMGPTISLKGIDNPSYYILAGRPGESARYYVNHSGCGNSLDLSSPPAMRLVMDSLRYWVEVMHVDAFRFDLASVLGRESGSFKVCSSFFDAVSQDPVLSQIKLIAEPWDISSYQVGNFPIEWMEWNGRYRDTVRKFIKGDAWQLSELGYRLTGSSDLYGDDGRSAYSGINYITCHDGFTLNDLVSYNYKHNDANKENNRDGSNENYSWNCGAEGETTDSIILDLRQRLVKNYFCCLLFSAGTPMILGGDEFLRTQKGNNNAYCQDNDISWIDWSLAEKNSHMIEFVKKTISFRKSHPVLTRKKFYTGKDIDLDGIPDISWYNEHLEPIKWNSDGRTLCYMLDASESTEQGTGYCLYFVFNADYLEKTISLPQSSSWLLVIDTSLPPGNDFSEENRIPVSSGKYLISARSVALFISK